MGSLRVRYDWVTWLSLCTFMHWRRKWQPTPVSLPGESQGRGALWAAVYGVAQSRTWLKWLSSSDLAARHHLLWVHLCVSAESLQLWPALCGPVDYSSPDSSVRGTLQARILKRVAVSSSRKSSQPRDWTRVSYVSTFPALANALFTTCSTCEVQVHLFLPQVNVVKPYPLVLRMWVLSILF